MSIIEGGEPLIALYDISTSEIDPRLVFDSADAGVSLPAPETNGYHWAIGLTDSTLYSVNVEDTMTTRSPQ